MELIRVGIVDDHLLFRKSLTLLIDSFEGMKVMVDAENGRVFLNKLEQITIDVVLLDLQMPIMDGYETCKQLLLRFPDVKILVVSQLSTRECIHKIMDIGAHGYFTKNTNPDHLEFAIRSLQEQGFYFGLELGAVMNEIMLWDSKNQLKSNNTTDKLSNRELEIIKMICKELKSKEIAEKLFINIRTVETHRKNIIEKTHSKNFIGVILYALKHNMISYDEFK